MKIKSIKQKSDGSISVKVKFVLEFILEDVDIDDINEDYMSDVIDEYDCSELGDLVLESFG